MRNFNVWLACGVVMAAAVTGELVAQQGPPLLEPQTQPATQPAVPRDRAFSTVGGVRVEPLGRLDMTRSAQVGDTLTVVYTGYLNEPGGRVFDSSFEDARIGRAFVFPLGQGRVIRGWDEGLVGVRVGDKVRLTIPPELAYGSAGNPRVPANSTLVFDIHVLGVEPPR